MFSLQGGHRALRRQPDGKDDATVSFDDVIEIGRDILL